MQTSTRTRIRAAARLLVLPLLALIVLGGWALSSPVGSSPDEDYHLGSIWCAADARTDLCAETGERATRLLPEAFSKDPCFSRVSTESAACQIGAYEDPALVVSDRGNFRGSYPPVFYGTMSLLVSDDVQTSVLAMRMLNAALFVGLLTALALLLPRVHRVAAVASFLITMVPLGLFLIPSINPSSWAVIGVGVSWLALLGYFETTGSRRIALGGIFAVGVLMAAGARADAAIYAILGIAAVLLLRFARTRAYALATILPIVVAVLAVLLVLGAGQLNSAAQGFSGTASSTGGSPTVPDGPAAGPAPEQPGGLGLALINLVNVPSLWAGVLGFWSLGWFDTPLPAVVTFASIGVFVAVAFSGLAAMDWRKALVFTGAVAALWVIPTWTLTRGGDQVGSEVQPRYLLPLIVLLAGFALLASRAPRPRLGRAQRWVVGLALAGAGALSLYVNIRRYVTGDDVRVVSLDAGVEWWWDGVIPPMALWIVCSLAWAALVGLLLRRYTALTRGASEATRSEATQTPGMPITR